MMSSFFSILDYTYTLKAKDGVLFLSTYYVQIHVLSKYYLL